MAAKKPGDGSFPCSEQGCEFLAPLHSFGLCREHLVKRAVLAGELYEALKGVMNQPFSTKAMLAAHAAIAKAEGKS